jgi:NAD(P)-dependent dehydrogenase (short-subunit alcohol dehydrogenase family)
MLINNAGFGSMGDFAKLDLNRELEMIQLNIRALVDLTHRFLVPMRETKARHDHQRGIDGRLSGCAVHGDLCGDEGFCAFVFGSACGKRTGSTECT